MPARKQTSATRRPAASERSANFYLLLGVVVSLSLFGLVMVFSASHATALADYNDSFYFLKRQMGWLGIGFVVMLIFAYADWRPIKRFAGLLFALSLIPLILVLVPGLGINAGGASRWISLFGIPFQPSELAKITLIFYAAAFLSRYRDAVGDWGLIWKHILWPFVALAGIIMLQPDLGTTLILTGIVFIMLFIGGVRLWHLAIIGAGGVGAVGLLIKFAGYRMARVTAFINPWKDPQNTGFQIIQSLIALGSGRWFGVGLGMSKQKFFYLPAAHTDFIYAIIGEELGLIGTLAVVIAFGTLVFAGVRIAIKATTYFDRLASAGVLAMITVQAVLNMGAVTGILPITGVPLPLISSGGTSLVFTLMGVGILLNIAIHDRKQKEGIIDARGYFRGGNGRTSVSRSRAGRGARKTG
jgi:cell division protein FtsW